MTDDELRSYATTYELLILRGLGDAYVNQRTLAERADGFWILVEHERNDKLVSIAIREQTKRQVIRLMAKALLHLSNHIAYRDNPYPLRTLGKKALGASSSADLVLILEQLNSLMFPVKNRQHQLIG
ncbi:hypothetical protein G8759_19845 [Spirosoma aureum]|uniref:Uncharacterized protein n=1 Tax=Spirosoma aureum TaxID=2692134 RepID=A0A6G9AQU0_9BACT|nr:hypothetical protein [Spirosoma aureum]QIP14704.1 hypothetical protein G8759_19845 [Spirosoma aureum]